MINISFLNLKVIKEKSGRYDVQRKITCPSDIFEIAVKVIEAGEQAEENLWLITLDTKNNITGIFEVSRGSINASIVHPREIFKRAIMQNASTIILIHNHPSSDPTPSKEDISITSRIKDCGKMLGIELIDHLIIGDNNYISLKEKGFL
jgi:DNA repair protein RadC